MPVHFFMNAYAMLLDAALRDEFFKPAPMCGGRASRGCGVGIPAAPGGPQAAHPQPARQNEWIETEKPVYMGRWVR